MMEKKEEMVVQEILQAPPASPWPSKILPAPLAVPWPIICFNFKFSNQLTYAPKQQQQKEVKDKLQMKTGLVGRIDGREQLTRDNRQSRSEGTCACALSHEGTTQELTAIAQSQTLSQKAISQPWAEMEGKC